MISDIEQMFKNAGVKLDTRLLTEGVAELKRQYPLISDNDYQQLIRFDPTYKGGNELGKYGRWILDLYNLFVKDRNNEEKYEKARAYVAEHPDAKMPPRPELKSQDKIEDFQKIPELLKDLESHLGDIKEPVQSFKSVSDLAAAVRIAMEKDVLVDEKAKANYKVFREAMADGLKVVYQDNDWIIGVPEIYEASSHFKRPVTDWCTAYPDMYEEYMRKYGGKYYIHLNKQTGELYQLHAESHQFKDRSDKEINKHTFIAKYPQLRAFYDKIIPMDNPAFWSLHTTEPSEETIIKALTKYHDNHYEDADIQGLLQYIADSKSSTLKCHPIVTKLVTSFYYPGSDVHYKNGNYIVSVSDMGEFFGDTIDGPDACERYINGENVFEFWEPDTYTVDIAQSIYDNLVNEHLLDTQNLQEILNGNIKTYTDDLIDDGLDESTATDIATKIQEYLEADFNDGVGVINCYDDCIRAGAEIDFSKDFENSFDCPLIDKETLEFGSGGLEYAIPFETYLKFISDIPSLNECDEIDSVYIIRLLYGVYATNGIFSEPRYGWEGFDIECWNNACKGFQEFLNGLFDKNG